MVKMPKGVTKVCENIKQTELMFKVPLDTKYVISRMLFAASLLARTEKTISKPEETTTQIHT